jgi:hypothetical protein
MGGRQVGRAVFLSRNVCGVVFHHRELAVKRRRVILPAGGNACKRVINS